MNKKLIQKPGFLLIFFLILSVFIGNPKAFAQQEATVQPDEWPVSSSATKPWARWWWMGSAVDKNNLTALLKEYADAGIGGLEIAPIYGAKGYENRFLDYLSPEWMEMLHHTIQVADSLGMGIDLTQGTGWPYGGPMVTEQMAAKRMIVQRHEWKGETGLDRPIVLEDKKALQLNHSLVMVMAYPPAGSPVDLTDVVDPLGSLNWNYKEDCEILVVFQAQTGQMVKRAAPGGQGFTLNHYDSAAVGAYLDHFEKAFKDKFPGIRAFYNDSFEVYGSDFTPGFFNFFEIKRGYDLRLYLPLLFSENPEKESIRLKSDYRQTINEMLLENFTEKWTNWAHQHGKKTKNQAHGSPGNLLDLYATVDIPEGETFGSSYFPIPGLRRDSSDIRNVDPDPIMLKFASSAAHLSGKNLVSSETFTWLGEHFKSSFSQAKPELEQAFLAGINHMFYHGLTYSPLEVEFPGWLFYASLNLNTHNSLWPHFSGFNQYIQRAQSVLQAGNPDNELLVYWPVFDVWADPEGLSKMLTVHGIDEWLHPTPFYKGSKMLIKKGYSLDFVSDALLGEIEVGNGQLLAANGKVKSKVLIIPSASYMPLATMEKILDLAASGARVVFQEKPNMAPGFKEYASRNKQLEKHWEKLGFDVQGDALQATNFGKGTIVFSKDLELALSDLQVKREALVDKGLKFIRRDLNGEKIYFLVNHTANRVDEKISFNFEAKGAVLLDPQQGISGEASLLNRNGSAVVRLVMDPGESMVVHLFQSIPQGLNQWKYEQDNPEWLELEGPWTLSFEKGGPRLPESRNLEEVIPWTALDDDLADVFSGQGIYESHFKISPDKEKKYVLDLGRVLESARVWLNEKEVGVAFGFPFKLDISDHLIEGKNTIKIEVANLMANRIRDMDIKGMEWRNYHEINFVNIDYGPFDASGWEIMPSGLAGPVRVFIHQP